MFLRLIAGSAIIICSAYVAKTVHEIATTPAVALQQQNPVKKVSQQLLRSCIKGIKYRVEGREKEISSFEKIDDLIYETCACRVGSANEAAADMYPDDQIAQGVLREWALTFFSEHIGGNTDIEQVMLEYTLLHPRQDILSEENIHRISRLIPLHMNRCMATFEGRLALVGQ